MTLLVKTKKILESYIKKMFMYQGSEVFQCLKNYSKYQHNHSISDVGGDWSETLYLSPVVLNLFTCCTPFKSPTNSRTPF